MATAPISPGRHKASTAAAAMISIFVTLLVLPSAARAARPCEDSNLRFVAPDQAPVGNAKRIGCSSSAASLFCTGEGRVVNIVDYMCPETCGLCDQDLSCADAPETARYGWTKAGTPKTCEHAKRNKGRSCTDGPDVKTVADALCPVTCEKCEAAATPSTTMTTPSAATTTSATTATPTTTTTTITPSTTTKTTTTNTPSTTTATTTTKATTTTSLRATTTAAATTTTSLYTTREQNGDDGRVHPHSQIMLYFEAAYEWQGTTSQRSWCMDCGRNCPKRDRRKGKDPKRPGRCKVGDTLTIAECDRDHENQWWIWDHGLLRSYSDDTLCIDHGVDKFYELRECRRGYEMQMFETGGSYNTNRRKFEVHPKIPRHRNGDKRCVTQLHHPKCGEKLLHQYCSRPRKHKTSYWIADAPPNLCGHKLKC